MKRTLLFLLIFIAALNQGYSQAKRYIFLEHFTNSRCGICASSNPGFYNLLTNYKNQYHHMTIHPPIPYPSCLLYQANPSDNNQRTNFYSILGTPTVVINGQTKKSAGSVTAANLNAELNKVSPIQIIVKETGTNQRNASIEIKTLGTKPSGNYRIYVVALEKELNYASPNGEKIHYNVFRDFLSAADGDTIDLANQGGSVSRSYTITMQPNWVESQMYIMAWIQDVSSKEVLNSGTRFDVITSNDNPNQLQLTVYPNPVKDQLKIELPGSLQSASRLSITNLLGKELFAVELNASTKNFQYPVSHFPKGIYFVRLQSGKEKTSRKWLKD